MTYLLPFDFKFIDKVFYKKKVSHIIKFLIEISLKKNPLWTYLFYNYECEI